MGNYVQGNYDAVRLVEDQQCTILSCYIPNTQSVVDGCRYHLVYCFYYDHLPPPPITTTAVATTLL